MSKRQQTGTARGVALVRALEMQRPAAERVTTDPYAKSFVSPMAIPLVRAVIATGLYARLGIEGMMNFAVVRERHIHDLMVEAGRSGIEQVVILGAGYDTRAYRIPEFADVPVFEVDHPVTQAEKRRALKGVVEPLPANVAFVGVDFDTDDLGQQLAAAGYDAARRTLFVWQGVIMYLTAEGVDRTLAFIAGHSAPGSTLVFDYMDKVALMSGDIATVRFIVRAMGERITFSIPEAEFPAFLEQRGFGGVSLVTAQDLRRLHLTGANAARPLASGIGIAVARTVATPRQAAPIRPL